MSTGLYLTLVYTLIPFAVIVIAVAGRPLLLLPRRLFPRLSEASAYTGGVVTAVALGLTLMLTLALSAAFSTSGTPLPPAGVLLFSRPTLYLLLILFGVPLAVLGLINAGQVLLTPSRRTPPGLISNESVYALSVAVLMDLGVLAEIGLMAQLAAG